MADGFEIAALVGTALGSMVGSYFVASRATKRRMDSEPPPRGSYAPALPAVDLAPLTQKIEAVERELRQEVRAMEHKISVLGAEAVTVEEFQSYVQMDGERRERLITKLAELQGSLAAVLPGMRK